jgi:hypothetical protein
MNSGQFLAPAALPPGNDPPVRIAYKAGCPRDGVGTVEDRKIFVLLRIEPRFLDRPVHSLPTMLSPQVTYVPRIDT